MMEILTWAVVKHTLLDVAKKLGIPIWDLYKPTKKLIEENLIKTSNKIDKLL
jgi:hypothetical protein